MPTRREYLAALGAGSVAGLAGCVVDDVCGDYEAFDSGEVTVADDPWYQEFDLPGYTVNIDFHGQFDGQKEDRAVFEFDYEFEDEREDGSYKRGLEKGEAYDVSEELVEQVDIPELPELTVTPTDLGDESDEYREATLWVTADPDTRKRQCGRVTE